MQTKENENNTANPNEMTGPHRGAQGVDKAPGAENREGSVENVVADTQKGKNKVDGDPSKESDQPVNPS